MSLHFSRHPNPRNPFCPALTGASGARIGFCLVLGLGLILSAENSVCSSPAIAETPSETSVDASGSAGAAPDSRKKVLTVRWNPDGAASGATRTLNSWTLAELQARRSQWVQVHATEGRGPAARRSLWRGVRLQELVDASLGAMTAEQRALVDLLVVGSGDYGAGKWAGVPAAAPVQNQVSDLQVPYYDDTLRIPRAVLSRTAWLVAFEKDGRPLSEPRLVLPDPQRPGVQKAGIPVTAGVSAPIATVELTSFAARFPKWILQRRSDPLAVRGETVFMQGCLPCHAAPAPKGQTSEGRSHFFERVSARAGEGLANSHSRVEGVPFWTERDWRSVGSYIEALGVVAPESGKPAGANASGGVSSSIDGPNA